MTPIADLVLSDAVAARFGALLREPVQSLLVAGPPGIGKTTIAHHLVAGLLNVEPDTIGQHPYVRIVSSPEGKAIGIEAVRELEQFLSLKVAAPGAIKRVILIDGAHLLTIEAQNALLKTLEEPPLGTVIILTSVRSAALLPTIQSRLQTLDITPPPADMLKQALLRRGVKSADIGGIMALAGNLPGLATALSNNDAEHPLVKATALARKLLQESSFDRLTSVDVIAKDKRLADDLLYVLIHMAHTALVSGRGAARWQQVLAVTYQAQKSLSRGSQTKLVLSDLMLNL